MWLLHFSGIVKKVLIIVYFISVILVANVVVKILTGTVIIENTKHDQAKILIFILTHKFNFF